VPGDADANPGDNTVEDAALHADREAAALHSLRARIAVVEGDLEREALGLCPDDLLAVRSDVTVVLHCAARIALEENIQSTLRANYYGTRELLRLAGTMPSLKAFVHVSTAYVNINKPVFPATVAERVYRLDMPWLEEEPQVEGKQGQQHQHQHQHQHQPSLGLRARAAAAEQQQQQQQPRRTTRATSAALRLRPTRSADNAAAVAGAAPDSPGACSSSSSTSIAGPASSTASGAYGAARRLAALLWSNGALGGRNASAARRAGSTGAGAASGDEAEDASLAPEAVWQQDSEHHDNHHHHHHHAGMEDPSALLHDTQHSDLAGRLMACQDPQQAQELVLSWTRRLGFPSTYCFGKHLAERMVAGWPGFPASPGARLAVVRPSLIHACSGADPTGPSAGFVANFGGPAGFTLSYALGFFQAPAGVAYHGGCVLDAIPVDVVTSMVLAAAAAASQEGRFAAGAEANAPTAAAPAPMMPRPHIYHAASSTSHPLTAASLFRTLARFYSRHPPPLRLPFTSYPVLKDDHRPHLPTVGLWRGLAKLKLRALCWALRWTGREREAKGLERGFRGWEVHNSGKYDRSLAFSTDGARNLASRLAQGERRHFTLLWHPSVMTWDAFFASYMAHSYRTVWKRDHRTGKKVVCAGGGGGAVNPHAVLAFAPAPAVAAAMAAQRGGAAARVRVSLAEGVAKGAAAARKAAACASPPPGASALGGGPVTRSRAVAVPVA
jgi:hypothetical protein